MKLASWPLMSPVELFIKKLVPDTSPKNVPAVPAVNWVSTQPLVAASWSSVGSVRLVILLEFMSNPLQLKSPLISTLPLISIVNTFPAISFVPKARRTFDISSLIRAELPNKIYDEFGFCSNATYEQSKVFLYPAIKALLTVSPDGALISLSLPCIKQLLPEKL